MKVYVLETGCYENRGVAGVFDSPERAMATQPDCRWVKTRWVSYRERLPDGGPDLSQPEYHVSWDNDRDWDLSATISEYDLEDTGALRSVDESRVQTYRESDGGWDYLSEPDQ